MNVKVCFLLSMLPFALQGQSVNTQIGGRAAGMGYSASTFPDVWSMFNNVGALGQTQQPVLGIAYDATPQLEGANRMAAAWVTPLLQKRGNIGTAVFRFGDAAYHEQLIAVGYGNQLGITSLGVSVNYIEYGAEGVGTLRAFSINVGGVTRLSDRLLIGAYVKNLNRPSLSADEQVPVIMAAGVSYQASAKVVLSSEVEKDIDRDAKVKFGMEYQLHRKFSVRTGFNLNPQLACFGLGYFPARIRIDYALQYVRALNLSHQVSIVYLFKRAEQQ